MSAMIARRAFGAKNTVIVGAKRTPIGCFIGGLKDFSAP